MEVDKENKMTEEFFEWLNNCPVQWFLNAEEEESISYTFMKQKNQKEE